jgi:tetratricopeptide (TPR) repeat protein
MFVRKIRWGCLLGMWLLAPVTAAATGGQLFAQGVTAFKAGDFQSAVRYFREARAIGFDLPALYYNLGASLYKLGRFAEAEQAFLLCARDPIWTPLAYYNAGLSAYRRGQRTAAAGYFERAWRIADSDEVRALALTMLERTDPSAASRARGSLALNLGYNDNVTLTTDSQTLQATSEADTFSEILASATGRWGRDAHAMHWDASLYDLRYATLTDNNITSVALGIGKPTRIASWYTDLSARWEYALRDGRRFQQIASVRLDGVRDRSNHGDLRLGMQLGTIDSLDPNFAFLEGTRQQVDLSLGQHLAKGRTRFGVVVERSDRADLTTANEFFSFSRLRYELRFIGSWRLRGYWRLEPTVRYARSRYADPDRRASGLVETREDTEKQLGLRVTRKLTSVWRLLGEFSYVDNDSNFAEFSYLQRVLWVGADRRF